MKDMKIIEVDMDDEVFNICDRYCMTERNERYFIAHVTNPLKAISVLWSDLTFIRRNYGVDIQKGIFNDNAKFTNESLNHGRKINIATMKQAIKLHTRTQDLEYLNEDGTWKLVDGFITDQYGNKKAGQVPYKPQPLTKSLKAIYEADIAKGLYMVCKAVEMGQKDFVI